MASRQYSFVLAAPKFFYYRKDATRTSQMISTSFGKYLVISFNNFANLI